MRYLIALFALVSQLLPSVGITAEQFATVDTFRIDEEAPIVTSLSVGSESAYSDDGFFSFDGFALNSDNQLEVPLTVRVRTDTPDAPPDFASSNFTFDGELISLLPSYSTDSGLSNIEVRKHFLTVQTPDATRAFVAVTEDPLPAIAWVAIAGIASVTGVSITVLITCSRDGGRIFVETKHEIRPDGSFVSTQRAVCELT